MERKELLKRLGSYTLTLSLITGSSSILTGCSSNIVNNSSLVTTSYASDSDISDYFVVINECNAIIYKANNNRIIYGIANLYYEKNNNIVLSDYILYQRSSIKDVEKQVKALVGDDGNISYYNFDQDKTLKKTR